jgi:predicted RNase H-like HicB family nuclease
MSDYRLSVEIQPLEEGGYLALCPQIEGCHAEGRTIGEALDNLHSVTRVIYALCREKDLPFITSLPSVPDAITWHIEVSPALKVAA